MSVALGVALFAGVLGLGHGGADAEEVIAILLAINLIFFGVGWLLRWPIKNTAPARLSASNPD